VDSQIAARRKEAPPREWLFSEKINSVIENAFSLDGAVKSLKHSQICHSRAGGNLEIIVITIR
jgi:hypothetical protein